MPEPGITDRNYTRPATEPLRGPIGRRPGGRRRQRLQIPREYANFLLEDGRQAIDVLGEEFFEPEKGRSVEEVERMPSIPDMDNNGGIPVVPGDPEYLAQDSAVADDEIASGEESAVAGVERFHATGILPPPFEMTPPLPRIEARRDPAGGWWHGAPRDGRTRVHDGIDLLAEPGTPVRSPISGTVRRINYTTTDMATITIRGDSGEEVKFLYVAPVDGQGNQLVEPGATVQAGQIIGSVEDLGEGYRDARTGRMKNHVHMRVSENGQPVDPLPWLAHWWENPEGSGHRWYARRHSAAPGTGNAPDYDAVGEGQRWRRGGEWE